MRGSNCQGITGARFRGAVGLGITEWRVIAMLGIEPDTTAQWVAEVVKLDTSAVSRALKSLAASGHVIAQEIGTGGRQSTWQLTDFGMEAHRRILAIALANELARIEGIPLADLGICQRVLRQMLRNLAALES
ncbi:MarR family winged helix-turn-helix transcriptional regulator [Tropicibacter naphthalenivorans]|uniref:MarR family protein n=1 Tax=Tropicibacter naphthalenivorans TaxID=441103 RepID=A0A0P1GYQ7_9RHOB|nr:MarR family winged helix-turn-helix transcriptional regulator [Tropicibacter naphthalenivorans]CUH81164.1 MarR family protein [Tropicibacter naphthalenivorans]SMC97490.1 DNA-binding transcriptional regulator, MarR family [Tropicibacter naphthalenivorans]